MEYITIKDCVKRYGKSSSTINRRIKKIKDENITDFKGKKVLRYITLSNKAKKILLLQSFFDSIYLNDRGNDIGDKYQNDIDRNPNTDRVLDIMENQLNAKDKQIENLQYLLLQSQKRLEVFDKMLKLGGKKEKIIINDTDEKEVETDYSSVVDVYDDVVVDTDEKEVKTEGIHTEDVVMGVKEEEVLVEIKEEEEKVENKRQSFLKWINEKDLIK
jgi:hypothetical protein|tara:strand:- start:1166 stop:1813 length:648 start_codon:yes stop_codon:yes gene_type:complete